MTLGEIIKSTRTKTFLSQEAFATELKVSIATINRWENSKAKPNITAMSKLKDFCHNHNIPFENIEAEWLRDSKEV